MEKKNFLKKVIQISENTKQPPAYTAIPTGLFIQVCMLSSELTSPLIRQGPKGIFGSLILELWQSMDIERKSLTDKIAVSNYITFSYF